MKADGEKRKWGGYPKMGLTPDEATTLIQDLEVGKSLGQLTRCASNPDYLVPVPRYLVHRKNQPDFRAKVDAITGFVCRSKALEHWRGGSPGLSPDMASTIMLGLRSGQLTIRHYTSSTKEEHYLCSNVRFRKHCELNPEWGVEARRLSNATVNRRKSENHPLRKATVCRAGLHEMTGDNVRIRSRGTRVCRACEAAASKRVPTPLTETEKERFKAVLTSGQPVTLQFLIQGKPVGGGLKRVKPLVMVKDFYHACRTDPDFARFVKENRPNTLSIGQRARRARELSIANRAKTDQDAKDYFSIQAMIPRWFPEQDKFDVVNDVMAELVAGVITRDELTGACPLLHEAGRPNVCAETSQIRQQPLGFVGRDAIRGRIHDQGRYCQPRPLGLERASS